MNIYDISKQAGVSIATVSRVLNGSPKVSPKTKEKVLQVMEQNGYVPNAFARSLGLNTMRTIGILCADASDIYLASAIYFLERELRKNGYASMLCCTGYHLEERQQYLQLLLSRNVDALFLVGSNFVEKSAQKNSYLKEAAKKVPIFILNGSMAAKNIYSILCDDRQSILELTNSILLSGSVSPIYLYRSLNYSGKRKLEGFLDACKNNGIASPSSRAFPCPPNIMQASVFLQDLADTGFYFDACIASDDELAVSAVKYAQASGRQVPGNLQITGYNASLLSVCSTPEITTVDNRVEFMCVTAVSLLMQVFDGKDIPAQTMFTGNIISRATTHI